MPTEERRMTMDKCKACEKYKVSIEIVTHGVCTSCEAKAVAQFIAARGADKPKAPTLEDKVISEIHWGHSASVDEREISERIIAMVREHDGTTEWKDRAEKAEVVVVHYRDQIAHRDGKIAVMKSQLEYLQDSIRGAKDALNK
jgi:hypothetical protein